jgi:hypothetical protein
MHDGCKVYVDSFMTSNGSCFMVGHLDYSQSPLLGGKPNTKLGDHGTLESHKY